jgi:hypothetical protein
MEPLHNDESTWRKRYVLMLLFNLLLIIAFAIIGHFFNR